MRRVVLNLRDDRPAWALPDEVAATIAAAFPASEWEVVEVSAPVTGMGDGGGLSEESLTAVADAEVWIGFGFPRALMDRVLEQPAASRRLRWIHSASAGVRSLLHPELIEADVVVTNAAGVHAEPIAETVIGALLHFARGFDFAVRAQARRKWDREPFDQQVGMVREIAGETLGILGYGGIGRAVARRAAALGMRVMAYRSGPQPAERTVVMVHGEEGLERVLRAAGAVVLALPSTPRTYRLLDRPHIEMLREDAVIVNVGRGETVEEAALASALAAGALRGAALDVFEREPLPTDSPLWALDSVLILPHVSPTTPRFWGRQAELIIDNVKRYLAGTRLRNVVDKRRGY